MYSSGGMKMLASHMSVLPDGNCSYLLLSFLKTLKELVNDPSLHV